MEKTLTIPELKKIASWKSCTFTNYITLEAKFGRILFDLSKYEASEVKIVLQKISGNGKFQLKIGEEQQNTKVLSKSGQILTINLNNDKKIEIIRPADSLGEISISNFILNVNEDVLGLNWKHLINQCGRYSLIRLIGDRLYASEGGYLEKGWVVDEIETNPPNLYKREDNQVKFINSCEITRLEVNTNNPRINPQPFIHREAPTPVQSAIPENIVNNPPITVKSRPALPSAPTANVNTVLYDSHKTRFSNQRGNLVGTATIINSNGQDYILLKKGGSITIPVSSMRMGDDYIIIITSKKLNGNGKAKIGCLPNANKYFISDGNFGDQYVSINTGNNENPIIQLLMGDDGVGEVLVSRIMIIQSLPIFRPIIKFDILPPDPRSKTIRQLTREAAIVQMQSENYGLFINCQKIIEPLTYSSRIWLSKVYPYLNGVKIRDLKRQVRGAEITQDPADLIMGSLGRIKSAQNLFIEEWNNEENPTNYDLQIISNSQTIFTPSFSNSQVIKHHFPDKQVKLVEKLWAFPETSPYMEDKFILYFEKDARFTRKILQMWKINYPKLIIVGTNQEVPYFIDKVSEYEGYPKLISYLAGACMVLDLCINNNYSSAILDICLFNQIPIITNNTKYLLDDDKEISYLNAQLTGDLDFDRPTLYAYVEKFIEAGQPRTSKLDFTYNNRFLKSLEWLC